MTALVSAARNGDDDAWRRLVQNYSGMLRSRIRHFRLSHDDAQDVIQTTWLLALQNLHRLQQETRLGAWLTTIAVRESMKLLKRSREISTDDLDTIDGPGTDSATASVDRRLTGTWFHLALAEAAAELPASQRELLAALTGRPDLRYVELAKVLGRPIGSIGPSRARTLARLRGLLAARGVTPDLLECLD
ncbi:sigma-70 family RNA polymerase sigma factor [Spirillospora sp. NPDC047279]|uniref:RNA polymerase sigma factor n=1 Tax=Spirillospora sp. NPDC047279 TaxID=3155478 RepID=UPI003410763E